MIPLTTEQHLWVRKNRWYIRAGGLLLLWLLLGPLGMIAAIILYAWWAAGKDARGSKSN